MNPPTCATALVHNGNNSQLRPESSENWSLGIDFKSKWLEGFEASTTYYNVAYKDKIVNMSDYMWQNYDSSPASYALYKAYIHPIHNPANCNGNDSSTWDPVLKYWAKTVVSIYGNIDKTQICNVNVVFDGANSNFASEVQRGLDINLTYLRPTDHDGVFNFGLYATTVLDNKNQVYGAAPIEQIGGINQPVRWRGRGSIGWSLDNLAASVFVNYTGPAINSNPTFSYVSKGVPAYYTTDVTVAYAFTEELGWSGFSGTRLTLSAQNVFDQNPPIELNGTTSAYDGSHYSALGRTVTLQLTKDF
jgi:iron complex outermembrane receptor protein